MLRHVNKKKKRCSWSRKYCGTRPFTLEGGGGGGGGSTGPMFTTPSIGPAAPLQPTIFGSKTVWNSFRRELNAAFSEGDIKPSGST